MEYIPNTANDQKEMLNTIGVSSVSELFSNIPADLRLKRDLNIPDALSEFELLKEVNALGGMNAHAGEYATFLGAGAYDHFIPILLAARDAGRLFSHLSRYPGGKEICRRGETIYEYQT